MLRPDLLDRMAEVQVPVRGRLADLAATLVVSAGFLALHAAGWRQGGWRPRQKARCLALSAAVLLLAFLAGWRLIGLSPG